MSGIPARGALFFAVAVHRSAVAFFGGLVAVLIVLALSSGAEAATFPVSGKQVVVSEKQGTSKMSGGLIGSWKITSFKEVGKGPIFRAKGTERFAGCLDRDRDGRCAGEPSGTLEFRFLYWGKFDADDQLVWGSCWHPVTGGSGDFTGASGVLMMVDTPTATGVTTRYTGNITLGGPLAARPASVPRAHCG
jgi:hypothetical protein